MDWRNHLLILLALLPLANCWIPIKPAFAHSRRQQTAVSPYIDIVLCPIRAQPWSCAREQSARILDIWDGELQSQWQKLKVEADRQLNATIEKRGYSASEVPTKEKPSTILKKIEIGTNFMKEYLAESMDGFLGHEFEYLQDGKQQLKAVEDEEDDDEDETDDEDDEEDEGDEAQDEENGEDEEDVDDDEDEDEEADADADTDESEKFNNYAEDNNDDNANDEVAETNNQNNADNDATKNQLSDGFANSSDGDEFIEIEEPNNTVGQLKKPGDKKKQKNKIKNKVKKRLKKKKGQQEQHATIQAQPATVLLVQQAQPQHHESDLHHLHNHHSSEAIQLHSTPVSNAEGHGHGHGHGGGGNKLKDKRKKRKNKNKRKKRPGHDSVSTVIVEEAPSNHLGFELLEELVGEQELLSEVGGKRKRKNKHPSNYGRSNGVTRGKKKKKKKAIMKLVLLGSFLKAKIELLLKILGAHLQIKFFAIALIGLLINIARFWIDVKRGGVPQKVVYVEHAHHQHHYEEQGEDWGEGGGGGGYWKRSLQTDPTVGEKVEGGFTDSYQPRPLYDAQYMAYRNQWQ